MRFALVQYSSQGMQLMKYGRFLFLFNITLILPFLTQFFSYFTSSIHLRLYDLVYWSLSQNQDVQESQAGYPTL